MSAWRRRPDQRAADFLGQGKGRPAIGAKCLMRSDGQRHGLIERPCSVGEQKIIADMVPDAHCNLSPQRAGFGAQLAECETRPGRDLTAPIGSPRRTAIAA